MLLLRIQVNKANVRLRDLILSFTYAETNACINVCTIDSQLVTYYTKFTGVTCKESQVNKANVRLKGSNLDTKEFNLFHYSTTFS